MFRAGQIKRICLIVIVSVLFMGMCPTGMDADSFFVSSRSHATQDATRPLIRCVSSGSTRTIAYKQETLPEYETVLTPITLQRRISMRQNNRDCFSLYGTANILSMYSKESGRHIGCLFDEIVSNTVIVNYIHHQDGAKA